ncbi:hypothetical protein AM493_18625 [Flavobacterium akiainvivens]|uniref:Lycopene cyclase domain-containing protein n=1 Tax=Flavobacterium akiainvivens TaxID=1202724 RepID=A0A0M9VJK1_9FLAO|nr:lycopene cyclase domain-containing protein [Flavobacterium akiainvivens]KOS07846.1 hypothetical protein AM493_18625 [Flavobacterium akiainvivens]SFQ27446.1 hypothetical protein SAMN05444144_102305 [Flavobacterium akiainvivens]
MDTVTYLLIGMLLILPWAAIYLLKPALRKKMLRTSLMGGLAGFIAEYWYFKDYWHPPTLLGQTVVSIEDFIFGFSVTGLAAVIYEAFFNINMQPVGKKRKKLFGQLFLGGVAAMMVCNVWLGINSIVVSCITFLVCTAIMIYIRPDLARRGLVSGLLMLVVVLPVYTFLFNLLNTTYWDKYWLLAQTKMGVTVLGHIPVTELCWYFSWGCMAGISHAFASGSIRVKNTATAPAKQNSSVAV